MCVCTLLMPRRVKADRVFVCLEKLFMKHETTCHVPPSCHCESQTHWRMTVECFDRLSKHTQSPNMPTHTHIHTCAQTGLQRHTSNTNTTYCSLMFQPLHIKADHRLPTTDILPIHQEVLSTIIQPMPMTCMQA